MNLLALTVFYGATAISLVESACSVPMLAKKFDSLCWDWWNKAFKEYTGKPKDRKSCVDLIMEKCPQMIVIESSVKRFYNGARRRHEFWITTSTARLRSDHNKFMLYQVQEEKPICFDDGVPQCDYWWQTAKCTKPEAEAKQVCIDNISKHCRNNIGKISEERNPGALPSKKGFDVITATYKYNGEMASFSLYVPQKKN